MNIVHISSEASPFIKVSELADVAGYLPKAIKENLPESNVKVIIPKYKVIDKDKQELNYITDIKVSSYDGIRSSSIYSKYNDGVEFIFIEYSIYFDRKNIYGDFGKDYPDNLERFVFFSKAVIEAIKALDFSPDIIHCHSWQTALVLVYINQYYRNDYNFRKTLKIYTIHNLSIQGIFPDNKWNVLGLDRSLFVPDMLEFWGKINIKKAGLLFSDIIITVSESYKREILTEEYGCGLEGVVRDKYSKLYGITNGVNYDVWHPNNDSYTFGINYDIDSIEKKQLIKNRLLEELDKPRIENKPIISFIGKFDEESGISLVINSIEQILKMDVFIIFIGEGKKEYEDLLLLYQNKHYEKMSVLEGLDDEFIHKIIAGSDIILKPARYEPCGLIPIYGLKYGTIPVVRNIGGMKDTITEDENGFVFEDYLTKDLLESLSKAVYIHKNNKEKWINMMINSMKKDNSWDNVSRKYIEIYKKHLNI